MEEVEKGVCSFHSISLDGIYTEVEVLDFVL